MNIYPTKGHGQLIRKLRSLSARWASQSIFQWVEDDSEHWMTPKIREAIYAFFIKHFSLPGHPREESYAVLTPEELQLTPNGQVSTFMQGKRIFDLNQIVAQKLYSRLEQQRQQSPRHLSTVLEKAKAISGFIEPGKKREQAMQNGKYQRDGYSIIKYATPGEGDYVIPWLLFVPKQITQTMPVIIYLHDQGKSFEASPNGEIERLLRQGCMVAAIDPLGIGETQSTAGRSITPGYTAVLIGRSVPGLQTGDVLRGGNSLDLMVPRELGGIHQRPVKVAHGVATGSVGPGGREETFKVGGFIIRGFACEDRR